jgi:hypothetical protein
MEFFNSKRFIMIIVAVLVAIAVSGCAKKSLETQGPKQPTTIDSVGKMKSIGAIIGCVFAPNDPECIKLKQKTQDNPHQTQQEYNKQITEEFNQADKDIK